jgi:Ser/Thr protein kinase RdoA (MazF antagonist)
VAKEFTETGRFLPRLFWYESRLLREDLEEVKAVLTNNFRESVADLIHVIKQAERTPDTHGLIHGDMSFGNFYLNEGELWIFDFDNCEFGFFLQDLVTALYDSIYCKVLDKFADPGLTGRMLPLWRALLKGYAGTGVLKQIDPGLLKKFFLLREAVMYVHYQRTMDVAEMSDSFKAGLEVMRKNVESQTHQVDFLRLL